MPFFIPLGFSCQSRFVADCLKEDRQSLPFDWIIANKKFLIKALESMDEKEFMVSLERLQLYEMTIDRIQGLGFRGVWFWHDFPRKKDRTIITPFPELNELQKKYIYLWERFRSILNCEKESKYFVISNTQSNLIQFASSQKDFSRNFSINQSLLRKLKALFLKAGVRNFRFIVMLRNIGEYVSMAPAVSKEGDIVRFFGEMSLPYNQLAVMSLKTQLCSHTPVKITDICGLYTNGMSITLVSFDSAIVFSPLMRPVAIVHQCLDGYLFSFTGSCDSCVQAKIEEHRIVFSDNSVWWKAKKFVGAV